MPPDAPSAPDLVLLDAQGDPRPPVAAELAPLRAEQEGEDDRLEPAGVMTPAVLAVVGGLVVVLLVFLGALAAVYRGDVGDWGAIPVHAFPRPELETNMVPRALPATLPGPAEARPPEAPRPDEARLARAMAEVAARGAAAYDPPPGTPSAAGPVEERR